MAGLRDLKTTPVWDRYWQFAAKRQDIYFRRLAGQSPPWTNDLILNRYKFTNVYRATDRVSQFLIRNVIYQGEQTPNEILFRAVLFKLFNRIETWELLTKSLGFPTWADFKLERYDAVLNEALIRGERIYSAAYIMPPADRLATRKHVGHLRLLERMIKDNLPERLQNARSMARAYELLRTYPMMGEFLAYQWLIDLNYSILLNFSEMDFVVPGPGAKRGIEKCFGRRRVVTNEAIIRWAAEHQAAEFNQRGLKFNDLFGRPMQLIDCQGLFCEVDKYSRVSNPEMVSGRKRIKQKFLTHGVLPQPWFPPKWGINGQVAEFYSRREINTA